MEDPEPTEIGADGESPQMKTKDWFTLFISLIALCISGINAYFTNFRVDITVEAAILKAEIGDKPGSLTVEVAVLNRGNKQVALRDATLSINQDDGNGGTSGTPLETKFGSENASSTPLIEPGNLAVYRLQAEFSEGDAADPLTIGSSDLEVEFRALSATGSQLRCGLVLGKISVSKGAFKELKWKFQKQSFIPESSSSGSQMIGKN
jgi:hypothetical protein